jgi:hypothetical protein
MGGGRQFWRADNEGPIMGEGLILGGRLQGANYGGPIMEGQLWGNSKNDF